MTLTSLARNATAAAAHALHHRERPHPAVGMDPYTVWMMQNLKSSRDWHR